MQATALVFFGAGIGGALRHGVNVAAARLFGVAFPWGTLIVNVLGSALMGVIIGWLAFRAGGGWTQSVRLFVTTGILGGFTTFSTFSLDTVFLYERGEVASAALYVVVSFVISVLALFAGLSLTRAIG